MAAAAAILVLATSGCAGSDATDEAATAQAAPATEIAESSVVSEAIADGAEVIDVRTADEFADGHLRNATNIDVTNPEFGDRISELDKTATYVVYCESGNRAGTAIEQMREQGFDKLVNGGGYEDLAASGLPTT